jgi:hypothetical protein
MATDDELADEIASLSAHLDAATQRLLACIRSFDESGGWERQGAISCAHWLSWRIGLDLVTAREKVRVARALGSLPRIDQALGRGELSYAKVRAITRAASPATEERLLEMARHSTGAQLDRICRSYRQVASSLTDEGALPEERSVRERLLPGGMVKIELVLHPDEAALVRSALEKAQHTLRSERRPPASASPPPAQGPDPAAGRRPANASASPPPAQGPDPGADASAEALVSLADAAVHLADGFLGDRPGASGGADRYQIFVHLDQDALGEDGAQAATLDDGTRVPAETFRRLACDAGLVATRTDRDGSVLDIGRRTRSIPPALRRALWLRDRGCRFPGCGHTRFLHGHHVQHWLTGGSTSLPNLVLLCPRHHRLVHEGGFTIDPGEAPADGESLAFRAPDGTRLPVIVPRANLEDAVSSLRDWAAQRGLEIGPDTAFPWWDGAVPDYDLAVSALMDEPAPAIAPATAA